MIKRTANILLASLISAMVLGIPVRAAEATELPDSVVLMSEEDKDLLARIAYHEAGNQDETGKRLVISVVLNRVDDQRFPNTVSDVLYQKGQFTTASELFKADPPQDCYDAAEAELTERTDTDVLFFNCNRNVYGEFLYKYGAHYFAR